MAPWRWFFLLSVCPWLVAPLSWQDSFLTRVELLALIETLNAELLSHSSATLTLERWCGGHGLASDAKLVARLDRGARSTLRKGKEAIAEHRGGSTNSDSAVSGISA